MSIPECTPTEVLEAIPSLPVRAVPVIAVPARLYGMDWRGTGKDGGAETTIVLSGLLSVNIKSARTSWRIEGSHGRHIEGPAASVGSAKTEALKALQRVLNSGLIDVESMLRVG